MRTRKFAFEMNWPLEKLNIVSVLYNQCKCQNQFFWLFGHRNWIYLLQTDATREIDFKADFSLKDEVQSWKFEELKCT